VDHFHRNHLLPGALAHVGDDRAEERVHATGAKERMGTRPLSPLHKWVRTAHSASYSIRLNDGPSSVQKLGT